MGKKEEKKEEKKKRICFWGTLLPESLHTGITLQLNVLFYFQTEQQLDCALDLMRRLPPQQIEKNLSDLIDLVKYTCMHTHTHTMMMIALI